MHPQGRFLPYVMEDGLQLLLLTLTCGLVLRLCVILDFPQLIYSPTCMTLLKTLIFFFFL